MKKLFVSLALFSVTVGAFAAGGSINFQNRSGAGKGAFIYSESSVNPTAVAQGNAADYSNREKLNSAAAGHSYVAGLFMEKGGEWVLISPLAPFRTGNDAGLWNGGSVTKVNPEGVESDSKVNLMVRAWDSAKAATWADVLKDGTVARGESKVISNYVVGAGTGTSVTIQATLLAAGLESFGLYTVVPEPSVIALGALGLGALLLRRRK